RQDAVRKARLRLGFIRATIREKLRSIFWTGSLLPPGLVVQIKKHFLPPLRLSYGRGLSKTNKCVYPKEISDRLQQIQRIDFRTEEKDA
ncbi:MAG TPA: hypothetical protein VMX35_16080, partial [Acidobacteriota bacterium]|nr:hypothetical protein [Acidobacteriota bacterium]